MKKQLLVTVEDKENGIVECSFTPTNITTNDIILITDNLLEKIAHELGKDYLDVLGVFAVLKEKGGLNGKEKQ